MMGSIKSRVVYMAGNSVITAILNVNAAVSSDGDRQKELSAEEHRELVELIRSVVSSGQVNSMISLLTDVQVGRQRSPDGPR